MPNTGERREITKRGNAKQAETVQESKKLWSKTTLLSAYTEAKKIRRIAEVAKGRQRADEEASSRMDDRAVPTKAPHPLADATAHPAPERARSSK